MDRQIIRKPRECSSNTLSGHGQQDLTCMGRTVTSGEWVTGQSSVGGATEPAFTSDFPGQQLVTEVYIMTPRPKEEAAS